ncbi:MAG: biosynthetic-type acetolactate synthase large subunit [Anaeroplasmataceae bacterium]
MKMNGSQLLIECLLEQGVDTIFGYPGGAVLNIYDALYQNSDRIKHILTSHEQGAAHAADGYARATGKVGVCMATSGPGATNLVTGIATAYMDSIPLVAITGNVGIKYIGKDSFQEIDITGVTMPITKHNFFVTDANELQQVVREAFYIAKSGRPGPVLIDICKNVTVQNVEYDHKDPILIEPDTKNFKNIAFENAARIINESKKPFIFAGGGVIASGAYEELKELVNKINSPIALSLMGVGAFPGKEELNLGLIGMHGSLAANKAARECDCLIALGVRFSDRVAGDVKKFCPNAQVIHFDVDPAEIGKNVAVDQAVIGDLKVALNRILPSINPRAKDDWNEQVKTWKIKYPYDMTKTEPNQLRPKTMMEAVYKATKGQAIITTEVGQHQLWAAQFYTYDYPRTLMTSGGLGTMGYGTGAAIGAQIGNPNRRVVHIAGDGSFRMNFNELATMAFYNVPVIVVVVNNKTLGMVRQWQTIFYGKRYSQTTLTERQPDFNKLADAFDITNFKATNQAEFEEAINKAVSLNEPVLINAFIDIDERVLPMIPAGKSVDDIIIE